MKIIEFLDINNSMFFQSAHSEEYSSIFKSNTITDLKFSNVEMF